MAEELAFQQGLGECPTVDGNERPITAAALGMDGLGHQLFAGTGFSSKQDRGIDSGHLIDEPEQLLHAWERPDQVLTADSRRPPALAG